MAKLILEFAKQPPPPPPAAAEEVTDAADAAPAAGDDDGGGAAAPVVKAEVSFREFLRMMKVVEERGLLGDLNSFITNLGDLSSFF